MNFSRMLPLYKETTRNFVFNLPQARENGQLWP